MKALIKQYIFFLLFFFAVKTWFFFTIPTNSYVRPEGCDQAYETISRKHSEQIADPRSSFSHAIFDYCWISSQKDMRYFEVLFKHIALRSDSKFYNIVFQELKSSELQEPELFQIIADALIWSNNEKQKSADVLFEISQNIPKNLSYKNFNGSFETYYLLLAEKKGNPDAKIKLDARRAAYLKNTSNSNQKTQDKEH